MNKEPETVEEWQTAVNGAEFYLKIDSAVQYGLIQLTDENGKRIPGSGVNVERCIDLIERGKEKGILPDPEWIDPEFPVNVNRITYSQPGRRCKLPKDYFKK